MKKIAAVVLAILMCLCSTVMAVGLLKPTMKVTVKDQIYTIEVSGLTYSQKKELESIIGKYIDDLDRPCNTDEKEPEEESRYIVYLVRNNKLYHVENGLETYIDTVCDQEIGIDKYNNVVFINEDYQGRYIYNSNRYPESTKLVVSYAKNLVNDNNVVTGIDYAKSNSRYTYTIDNFSKDTKNEQPVVIFYQESGRLNVLRVGESIRITSSLQKNADNPIAVTEKGDLIYVTTSGYVYQIGDIENISKISSTTPSKLSEKNVIDIEIENGKATYYVYSNGTTKVVR